jgi:hypothetical protein
MQTREEKWEYQRRYRERNLKKLRAYRREYYDLHFDSRRERKQEQSFRLPCEIAPTTNFSYFSQLMP